MKAPKSMATKKAKEDPDEQALAGFSSPHHCSLAK